ncbi:oligosaccharide flippase family protein [Pseudoalteromonas luteoviolacea]|uniref:Polysaccharide biosynthesis protein C-terminal domain-containing protein n=1 Tax=Pseudoalteromonas luteoviolacea H33 TaxID=1365251 RepID=A0A167EYP4_9GAMM|nr:oligosaccharide flippase family protein [Pseudoalteromonas luteoviolacea]KZN51372.1 hypothetical protein N476_13370 [Pseudoalteromonas luteoviolacea H33]KZN71457.1 hypothetical protein N477_04050 [Pseudoalteromonas luteoviolacea H33-S]MBQ4876812.1 oligosaccharide flippase family protein [Pseudoalteromonas luteoviolacea]MBQ4905399.1 oligosaccharide flippase family protein [Pseudoalteromonas luteoviolacea]
MRKDLIETSSRFVITAILQLSCFLVSSKVLSIEEFGVLSIVLAYAFIGANISVSGLPASLVYFFTKNNYKLIVLHLTVVHSLVVMSLFSLGIFIAWQLELETFLFASLIATSQFLFIVVSGVLQASNKIRLLNIFTLAQWGMLSALLVYMYFSTASLYGVVISYVLSFAIPSAVALLVLKSSVIRYLGTFSSKNLIKKRRIIRIYKYGFVSFTGSLIGFLNHRLDLLIVGGILGTHIAGLYSFAIQIVERLSIFSQAFTTVYFPKLRRLNGRQSRLSEIKKAIKYLIIILIPTFITFFVFYEAILKLFFDSKYEDAYKIINILAVGVFVVSINRLLFIFNSANGDITANLKIGLMSLGTNVTLSIAAVFIYGESGIALVTCVVAFLSQILVVRYIRKSD